MNIFIAALLGLSFTSFLCLYRLFSGPTVFDRIVAAQAVTTKTIVVVVILAFLYDQDIYLDISITYAILSFLAVLGVAVFITQRREKQ
ncbi:MAG: hypothetical protein DDT40_00880 [candidate division WS2 bacterium]|nr:hypothetical protein [Candidatus Psychracetigena formicireducens]MBT9138279.1 hypothetical protein [Bacillota bacterium]MBT9150703.1 hypothetical protein [Candidatus Psychracetigena formicireducens]